MCFVPPSLCDSPLSRRPRPLRDVPTFRDARGGFYLPASLHPPSTTYYYFRCVIRPYLERALHFMRLVPSRIPRCARCLFPSFFHFVLCLDCLFLPAHSAHSHTARRARGRPRVSLAITRSLTERHVCVSRQAGDRAKTPCVFRCITHISSSNSMRPYVLRL